MNPTAEKLLKDLRASWQIADRDTAKFRALIERSISYVQSTADPENQPSQYGTTLVPK